MPVPLLDVNAQNHPLSEEFHAAFQRVFQTGQFIMGAEVTGFEASAANLIESKHAIGVSSGTDAILLALMALGIGPGDEVLVPAFTFFATAGCVSRLGATPVFVDVLADTFNINMDDARAKVTPRTKAIIPVHLFGQCADMDAVMALASDHGLFVIEDAAQAIGARYKDRSAGSMGHFGCYSFFPSKNLGGLGDAGLLSSNDDTLAAKAVALRNHGMEPKYYHSVIGGNFRLDALQAAFLSVKLPHYGQYTAGRQRNAAYYAERLSGIAGIEQKIILPQAEPHNFHIWNQFTLRVLNGQRDQLKAHLTACCVGSEIYYPLTLDQQQCFAHLPESARKGCETSHRLAQEVLSIPIYPELKEAQREEVVNALSGWIVSQDQPLIP